MLWANRYGRELNCEEGAMLTKNDTDLELLKVQKARLELEIDCARKELSKFKVRTQYKAL